MHEDRAYAGRKYLHVGVGMGMNHIFAVQLFSWGAESNGFQIAATHCLVSMTPNICHKLYQNSGKYMNQGLWLILVQQASSHAHPW